MPKRTPSTALHPYVSWIGCKRRYAAKLAARAPPLINKYFEPFAGSAAVFGHLKETGTITRAVLTDIDRDLIEMHQQVQDNPEPMFGYMEQHARRNNKHYFHLTVERYQNMAQSAEKAAAYWYLIQAGYASNVGRKKDGTIRASYGHPMQRPGPKPLIELARRWHIALRNTRIKHCSWNLIQPQPDDFVYLDPPYFNKWEQYRLDRHDDLLHHDLRERIDEWTKEGVNVMMSNSNETYIQTLFDNYNIEKITVYQSLMGHSQHPTSRTELIITNYNNDSNPGPVPPDSA